MHPQGRGLMGSVGSLSPAAGSGSLATPNDTGRSIRRREVTPSGLDKGSRFTAPRETKTPAISPGPGRSPAATDHQLVLPRALPHTPLPPSPSGSLFQEREGRWPAFCLFSGGLFQDPPKRPRASRPRGHPWPSLPHGHAVAPGLFCLTATQSSLAFSLPASCSFSSDSRVLC